MPSRSTAESRAEARRRARLAARGESPQPQDQDDERSTTPARAGSGTSFLRRIFPPAPPLDRPDPLRDFHASGPLRPVLERLYLLRLNPLAWIVPGVLWWVSRLGQPDSFAGLIGSLVSFAVLIAAGWFGWQRPTLYGTSAAIVGFTLYVGMLFYFFFSQGFDPVKLEDPLGQIFYPLVLNGLVQVGIGYVSGWYGGYLRRRQAQLSSMTGQRRR